MVTSSNETLLTVKYSIYEKEQCSRCGREHDEESKLHVRDGEFDSTVNAIIEWFGWSSYESILEYPDFDEELAEGIWEHYYNAINFFCANSYEDVEIDESTLDPVFESVKNELILLKSQAERESN